MCSSRYQLSLHSQQQELPLAKDEKLVSWEEIILREETDNVPCSRHINPLLPPLPSAAVGCEGVHVLSSLAPTISMLSCQAAGAGCARVGQGLGLNWREGALQLFFSSSKWGELLLTLLLPKGDTAIPSVKTGSW